MDVNIYNIHLSFQQYSAIQSYIFLSFLRGVCPLRVSSFYVNINEARDAEHILNDLEEKLEPNETS